MEGEYYTIMSTVDEVTEKMDKREYISLLKEVVDDLNIRVEAAEEELQSESE